MKKIGFALATAGLLVLASCTKQVENYSENRTSAGINQLKKSSVTAPIVFTETDLFPEGVAYDSKNDRFLVSSFRRGDIGIVTADGSYTPFITDPTLMATTGLEIDMAHQRLYVSNAPNGVGVYDLATGDRIFYADLAALLPGAPIFVNDIALDPQGNAYVTNSFIPIIYKITPDGDASIFINESSLALPGQFGFNGIEYSNSGLLLVAYTAMNAILKFPIKEPSAYSMVQLDASLARPDGLLLSPNGKELTVVNNAGGGNGMVLTFTSRDKFETASLQKSFSTGPVFPTTATTDGKTVFVIYAYLNKQAVGQNEYTIQPIP